MDTVKEKKKGKGWLGWLLAGIFGTAFVITLILLLVRIGHKPAQNITIDWSTGKPEVYRDTIYIPWESAPRIEKQTIIDTLVDSVLLNRARISYVYWNGIIGEGRVRWADTSGHLRTDFYKLPHIDYLLWVELTDSLPVMQTVDLRQKDKWWYIETEVGLGVLIDNDTSSSLLRAQAAARLVLSGRRPRRIALEVIPIEIEVAYPGGLSGIAKLRVRF